MDIFDGQKYKSTALVNSKAIRNPKTDQNIQTVHPRLDCRPIDGLRNKLISLKTGPIKPGPKIHLQKLLEKALPHNESARGIDEKASASVPNTSRDRKFILNLSTYSLKKASLTEKGSNAQIYRPIESDMTLDLNFKRLSKRGKLPLYMQSPTSKLRSDKLKQVMTMKPQECSIMGKPLFYGLPYENESLMDDYIKFKCSESPRATSRHAFTPRAANMPRGAFSVNVLRG